MTHQMICRALLLRCTLTILLALATNADEVIHFDGPRLPDWLTDWLTGSFKCSTVWERGPSRWWVKSSSGWICHDCSGDFSSFIYHSKSYTCQTWARSIDLASSLHLTSRNGLFRPVFILWNLLRPKNELTDMPFGSKSTDHCDGNVY